MNDRYQRRRITGGDVLPSELSGQRSLVVRGDRIVAVEPDLSSGSVPCEDLDADGCYLVPGFVDGLAHIAGGGGEGGFATRTPETRVSDAIRGADILATRKRNFLMRHVVVRGKVMMWDGEVVQKGYFG